jgi:hypothetical protein
VTGNCVLWRNILPRSACEVIEKRRFRYENKLLFRYLREHMTSD